MNTKPKSNMVAGLLGMVLAALSVSSCSDDTAPQGATIVAPGELTMTYSGVPVGGAPDSLGVPLEFQVLDADGNPLPGVRVRYFSGVMITQLADRADTATAVPLTPSAPLTFETETNEQGLSPTDIFAHWFVTDCGVSTTDIETTGNVIATVGVASAEWTVNITTSCS